jgi:hypothetical protein
MDLWRGDAVIQKIGADPACNRDADRPFVCIDAEEKNLIAAAVVEIFVRQHMGLGVFKFTNLPVKDDYLCLPSAGRRGRLNRYVVTDVVAQNADPERMSENTAELSHARVYVSFCDEI